MFKFLYNASSKPYNQFHAKFVAAHFYTASKVMKCNAHHELAFWTRS